MLLSVLIKLAMTKVANSVTMVICGGSTCKISICLTGYTHLSLQEHQFSSK